MSTYKKVSYGSSGSDVKTLQEMLNNNGYSLDVDGNFGSKTQAAVKDYQQKNNLAVNGIADNDTWGALTSKAAVQTPGATPEQQTGANTTAADTPKYENKAYQPSDAVTQAEALLNQQMQQKPGAYQSNYQGQLNDIINQILSRDKFSYDLNSDALYQQYANQYSTQGKLASMDVMGQAAAMTGGYGNSYAQTVGQQTYQGYLQQLNDVIPELYQMALNQYNQEGQALYDQAALLGAQEEQEYGRYRDQVSDFYSQLQQLYNQYNAERDYDYSKYTDDRNFGYEQYLNDQNLQYQKERDQVEDERWQKEYDFALQQYNDSKSSKGFSGGSGGSNGGSTGKGSGNYDDGGLDKSQIKEMQEWYGTDADGIWGNNSAKAADGRSVTKAWEYYQANKGKEPVLDDAPTFTEIAKDLNNMIAKGKTSGEVTQYLNYALLAGYITNDQYKSLKNSFAPRGHVY